MNRGMDLETILKIAIPLILFVVVPILNEIAKVVRKVRKVQEEYRRTGRLPSEADPALRPMRVQAQDDAEPMPLAVDEQVEEPSQEPSPTAYDARMRQRRRELEARRALRQGRRVPAPVADASGDAQMDAMREALAAIGIHVPAAPVPAAAVPTAEQEIPRAVVIEPAPRPASASWRPAPKQTVSESHASASSLLQVSAPSTVTRTAQRIPLATILDRADWTPLQRAFVLAEVFGNPAGIS